MGISKANVADVAHKHPEADVEIHEWIPGTLTLK